VSQSTLVPIYHDGQDRRTAPVEIKTHREIKEQRKAGLLHGWYVDNGNTFVLYRPKPIEKHYEDIAHGSGFDSAWHILQSGYAGPNTWQLKTA
jgi:hypothetical protein